MIFKQGGGGSSVLFAYLFPLLFGEIDNILQGRAPVFSLRGIQGELFKGENLPFPMWFQRYDFLKDPPQYFMGKP